jgi:hypothetical protein
LDKLDRIIAGDLTELITALRTHRQASLLQSAAGAPFASSLPVGDEPADDES